jgi:S1-C subfamily serine protease
MPEGDALAEEVRDRLEAQAQELARQAQTMRRRVEREMGAVPGVLDEQGLPASPLPGKGRGMLAGARLRVPEPALVAQLSLPRDQGLVLEDVAARSAAARAGLKNHDILLELGSKPVPSKEADFAELLKGIAPGKPVEAVVVRKARRVLVKQVILSQAQQGKSAP